MMKRLILAGAACLTLSAPLAAAEDFPRAALHMVVPFSAGGTTDVAARVIAKGLSEEIGQAVVVENRPGAGTKIGSNYVAQSRPDGYTLLLHTIALAVSPFLNNEPDYDYRKEFDPVARVYVSPVFLTLSPTVPASNIKEFVDYLKENEQTPYGTAGIGSAMHIAVELLRERTGTDLLHVPYKGESEVLTNLVSGEVKFAFTGASASLGFIESGKLKSLGYAGEQRSPLAPELPTISEAGLDGFVAQTWGVVLAPVGTPQPVVEKINQALNKALSRPDLREKLIQLGYESIVDSTPAGTDEYIIEETKKYSGVMKNSMPKN
ncbi:tripartite tricarboxylate transporter substrate binding protein [Alcaligenaceae bacterium]|nr:tripartite tricarboxylate transporter substrate binding protein [Alcaligenaceae bacterium]